MRKLVFLDFDGVLNNSLTHSRGIEFNGFVGLDPENINHLNKFLRESGPDTEVVVSSTWRHGRSQKDLQKIFDDHEIKAGVAGVTPCRLSYRPRGLEIQGWLDSNGCDETNSVIVIIDDIDEMLHLSHRLIKTDSQFGFQAEHVERALQMLNGLEE